MLLKLFPCFTCDHGLILDCDAAAAAVYGRLKINRPRGRCIGHGLPPSNNDVDRLLRLLLHHAYGIACTAKHGIVAASCPYVCL